MTAKREHARAMRFVARACVASLAPVVLAAVAPSVARADPSGTVTPDRLRLDFVEATLERDASSSRLWYFGWSGFYAAVGGTELALALTTNDVGLRSDTRVGAVTAGLGFLVTFALPPRSLFYERCSAADEATPEARAACLARQQDLLAKAAAGEWLGHSWLARVGGIAVNVGAGLFLWQHDNRLASGVLALVSGVVVSQLQIFTAPTFARDAHDRSAMRDVRFAIAPTSGGGAVFGATKAF